MNISQSLIEEVYSFIKEKNSLGNMKSIVHSDDLIRHVGASAGVDKESIKAIIGFLHESHKILTIEIVAEDKSHKVEKIEGYLIADLGLVKKLKALFQEQLAILYEKQHNKRLGVAQVIKEIFPMMKHLNNTEMGQIANKAIMLNEYEHLLTKNVKDYTDVWQEEKMLAISAEAGFDYRSPIEKLNEAHSRRRQLEASKPEAVKSDGETPHVVEEQHERKERAVDSPAYKDFTSKKNKYPLSRIIRIYGIDFFLKVQMRNYQFEYLKQLIEDKQLDSQKDLQLMRDMLGTVKANFKKDAILFDYKKEIADLERAILHAMYFSSQQGKQ